LNKKQELDIQKSDFMIQPPAGREAGGC